MPFAWATEENMRRVRIIGRIHAKLGLKYFGLRFENGKIYRRDRRRPIGTDLESLAHEIGVLHPSEHLAEAPLCTRCRSRAAVLDWTGGFLRQCSRCYEWSRSTRRDPTRCTSCRRTKDKPAQARGVSRCSECHETKLERERNDRFLMPPWERVPRPSFWN
jgi:hypothetical protein